MSADTTLLAKPVAGASRVTYLALASVLAVLPWIPGSAFFVHLAGTFCFTAIAVLGLNLLLGLSGQMSLGQAGFYALGAYGSALLALKLGVPVVLAITFGTAVAALGGVLVGIFALRTRGLYLAMATMAIGFIIEILAQRWVGLTGGAMGLTSIPQFSAGTHSDKAYLYASGLCLLLALVASDYVIDSGIGRRLRAIRESEVFAASVGIAVPRWRAGIFGAGAALAGLGGALFAHQSGYVGSDAFTIRLSIAMLIAAVIGGLGTKRGPLLGTLILIGLAEAISGVEKYGLMIYGSILLGVLTAFPQGAAGLLPLRKTKTPARIETPGLAQATLSFDIPAGARLSIQGISKSYAGVRALVDASIEVAPGTVHGLIGPNGAGKSTLINVVAGLYRCDSGRIELGDRDVTPLETTSRSRLGLARTFQNLQLIDGLSALDNVILGLPQQAGVVGDVLTWWKGTGFESDQRTRALHIMATLGIADVASRLPPELSYGHRKLVELARAIAQRPTVMLLDEPIAGLNSEEAKAIADVVRRLRSSGATVLVVEHNMEFVMSVCDHVSVLDHGVLIATGTPAEVQCHPEVLKAYLGHGKDE